MATYDPFMGSNPVVAGLEARRGFVEQVRENSARIAEVYASFPTSGSGVFRPAKAVLFGCTYVERPVVAYGYSLAEDEELVDSAVPRATGGVCKWVQDERNFYTGAYVFLTVDVSDLPTVEPTLAPLPVADPSSPTPPPAPAPTTSVPSTPKVFTDLFDRPNNPLVGKGWQQTGGDFYIDTQRCITRDATSWMGQPFGHVPLSVAADLRSPDVMSPCVWAWGSQVGGGPTGYEFAFSASAVGTNMTLRAKGKQVAAKHYGTANKAIGNATLQLRMVVTKDDTTVTVRCYVGSTLQFTYSEPIADAPTGQWTGVGNSGVAGNVSIDGVVITEMASSSGGTTPVVAQPSDPTAPSTPTVPSDVAPSEATPTYVLLHDFTFTGIAMKDVPGALLEPGVLL